MLLSHDHVVRQRTEEYLIAKLLKWDKHSAKELLNAIRSYSKSRIPPHRRIWALLVVGRHAR